MGSSVSSPNGGTVAGNMSVPATLEDVAAAAGVSRSTVSRVINGATSVSPQTLEAVDQAIKDLGYVPNRVAQSLASRRARAVALVVPEDTIRFFGDPFFAAVVSGIDEFFRDTDIVLNLLLASSSDNKKTASYLTSGNADGALVLSHHAQDNFIDAVEQKIPVVYGGRPAGETTQSYYVDVDNHLGAVTAVEHLLSRGCKRIATITGPLDMQSGQERLDGYTQVVSEAGMEPIVACGDYTREGGAKAMVELLEIGQPFDGVFVASDLMARGAIEVMASQGMQVPDDLLMIGFDDSPAAVWANPQLSTISQPSRMQGYMMAKLLMDRLSGEVDEPHIILATELVQRQTA